MKLLIIILLIIFNFQSKNSYAYKFSNKENQFYILEFPNRNISTNNLNIINKNIQIIWIEPYEINKKYQFKNIDKFMDNCIKDIAKNNYSIEVKTKLSGVLIKRVKVYTNLEKINQLNIENLKIIN